MVSSTTEQTTKRTKNGSPAATSLDDLSRLSAAELQDLYIKGTVPGSLAVFDGDLVGRMLAVRGLDRGAPFHFLTSFSRSKRFPWAGKSFRSTNRDNGTGINRLDLGRSGGKHRVFPFETHFGTSVVDDKPAVILDYDLGDNPPMIRAIHDELREVAPKLFLGPACVKRGNKPTVVLWFALDAGAR
jgi:hypothetical protein